MKRTHTRNRFSIYAAILVAMGISILAAGCATRRPWGGLSTFLKAVAIICALCAEVCPNKIMKKDASGKMSFRQGELRRMFSIPDENEVVASMILGYPRYKYRRGIKRTLKSVKWI